MDLPKPKKNKSQTVKTVYVVRDRFREHGVLVYHNAHRTEVDSIYVEARKPEEFEPRRRWFSPDEWTHDREAAERARRELLIAMKGKLEADLREIEEALSRPIEFIEK